MSTGGAATETSEGVGSKPGEGTRGEEGTDPRGFSELALAFPAAKIPATTGAV